MYYSFLDKNSPCIYLKLPQKNIVFFKFVLESYEGLGVIRTLNPETGEIVIFTTEHTKKDLLELIESLKSELQIEEQQKNFLLQTLLYSLSQGILFITLNRGGVYASNRFRELKNNIIPSMSRRKELLVQCRSRKFL